MLKSATHREQQAVILSQVLASNVTLGAEDIVDCAFSFFSFFLSFFLFFPNFFLTSFSLSLYSSLSLSLALSPSQAKSTASTGSRSTPCARS